MDVGNIKTKKVRFIPSKKQKELFNKCFQAHRFFYNKAIGEINRRYQERLQYFQNLCHCVVKDCSNDKLENSFLCKDHQKSKIPWKLDINHISLRKSVMMTDKEIKALNNPKYLWQLDIPYDTRNLAIKEALSAYKSALTLKQNGYNDGFEMKFISKNKPTKIFCIDHRAVDDNYNIFKTRLKDESKIFFKKRDQKRLPNKVDHDLKMLNDHGKYYLLIPVDNTKPSQDETSPQKVVSLDPGIRTFQTCYDPSGSIIEIGDKMKDILNIHLERIDHLKSVLDTCDNRRKRRNIRKRIRIILKKCRDIVSNLHNQTSVALTKNYENIILPEFCTSKMLKGKRLHRSVKRMMNILSFYKFKEKMRYEASKRSRNLYIVTEEYTSKTCTRCGKINNNLGSSKVFKCDHCSLCIDRDVNGARNILIKHTQSID